MKPSTRTALQECEESRWQCLTCSMPSEEDGDHCSYCRTYWEDCSNGLWDITDAGRRALATKEEGDE